MTTHTATASRPTARGCLLARLRRWQQRLSGRVHAPGDGFARRAGWTVTPVTGRPGFSGRLYRGPRFAQRPAFHRLEPERRQR